MIYLNEEDYDIAIIRGIFNLWHKFSIITLIGGHGQAGKTTLVWYMANRLMQLRRYGYRALDPLASCNTWREWDAYKLTALNAQDFVRLWNNNTDSVLALAEPSTQLYYLDWMGIMGRVFNSTTTTQGKQHNICFLDTVMESEIMQKARDKVDFRIEVHKRIDSLKRANIRSGWTLIDYLGMKWMLIRNNEWNLDYSPRMLLMANQYTNWISNTLKKEEAELNERRVGIRPFEPIYNPSKPINDKNMPDWVRKLL